MKKLLFLLPVIILTFSCSKKEKADLIISNATIYTVDNEFTKAEAAAIKDGKFIAVGSSKDIQQQFSAKNEKDLKGKFVYPGFIDAHCHFYGYSMNLRKVDLVGTQSVEEIIERLKEYKEEYDPEWILGRGWDQNDWEVKEFPHKKELDEVFPETPVYLTRIDGHAAYVNSAALKEAGISKAENIEGGKIHEKAGEPTGILIDNAMNLVSKNIPNPTKEEKIDAIKQGEDNCFQVGLTMVADAGLGYSEVQLLDSLQKEDLIKMNIYAMLSPTRENIDIFVKQGAYKTEKMHIKSIKLFADGALGSRGACLLEPYSDDPDNYGLIVTDTDSLEEFCQLAYENNYQVNTHAIGDSANRLMLNIYGNILDGENERRWRIEHAQIIHPEDFKLFGKHSIIPAINTTHATSDMPWAEERLGEERLKNGYAYKKLLKENSWLPNGSDFPVEHINPLYGFYAGVARKDLEGYPEDGFQKENALSRKEALKAMTIWAAKSCFQENERGSIQKGKEADFVVTEQDIMEMEEEKIPDTKVMETYIQGTKVYGQ
ncbi:MAG: amidohydrolase [Bacteroidales bacterium]